jgi:hypothetical protein
MESQLVLLVMRLILKRSASIARLTLGSLTGTRSTLAALGAATRRGAALASEVRGWRRTATERCQKGGGSRPGTLRHELQPDDHLVACRPMGLRWTDCEADRETAHGFRRIRLRNHGDRRGGVSARGVRPTPGLGGDRGAGSGRSKQPPPRAATQSDRSERFSARETPHVVFRPVPRWLKRRYTNDINDL